MATQFIKNNTDFSNLEHWQGFSSTIEKDGFKTLNLKQINANYDEYIELKEETTYTLWCEVNSTYLQQVSTIKGLLFDCFFVKEDGSYDEDNIYDAYAKFDIKSQERSLQPNKWQVIELRIVTKSLEQAKDEYTRIMFRPKFLFNNDEENGIDIYIKNVSFEDSDRRYFGNNLIVDSSKCENNIYKLNNVERTKYRYYGGYIFITKDDIKGNISFNVAKDLFKHRILRNGDKVKYSIFARTNSENIRYSNMAFYMKRYNINTQEDVESYFYRSEYVGDIDDIWRRFEFVFTVTSQMIDDSGNNLLWGDSGIFFNGKLEDDGVIYYACPMLEIVGDDSTFSEEWIPNKNDDIYNDYLENLVMSYGSYEKDIKLFIRKNGEQQEKEISYYTTSYEEDDSSSSNETFKLGNVGSKTVKIGIRNYDDDGNEILPRDLTNYLLYVQKYYQNGYDDSGDIFVIEGKYKIYENPEDFSNNMTIEFQDRMVELDIEYNSELEYPTTIRKQLEEITSTTNMLVDYSQIDESILNESINFYDNTYTKREYLSWIGEKSSCNVFIDDDLVIFRKIDKQNIKEQYVDYASQDLKFGDEFRLRTVTFDNGVEYYSKSNDLMKNDDSVFTLKMENETNDLSINTNVKVNLEENKTYTFDFKSNISVIGSNKGEIKAKLVNADEQYSIDINAFETTFKCLRSDEYTLWFYFKANQIGDVANFSNFHIVESDIAYGLTNTFYVTNENMYITSQKDIDNIYSNVYGLDVVGCDNLSLIIGNPKIKAIDLVRMRFIDEMESEKYNRIPFVVYVSNHKLTFNKSFKSAFECPIQSTNEENTQTRKNVNTRIKKISVDVDHNEQRLEIIAQDVEQIHIDIDNVGGDIDEINEAIDGINSDIIKIDGDIVNINGQIGDIELDIQGNIESIERLEQRTSEIELDIDGIDLSVSQINKDIITINGSIGSINGSIDDINGNIGNIQGDITDINGDISDINGNITNITGDLSNAKIQIETNKQNISQINLDIEKINLNVSELQSTTTTIQGDITDINGDISDINVSIKTTNEKVAQIELDIDSIDLSISNVEKEIVDINGNVSEVTKRLESAEIKLEPTNIILSVNTAIDGGQNIHSTKFQIDKNGVHISGGGLDISNNSGEKVFYADGNGNLTLKGTITGSSINGTNISGGNISGTTISGTTINGGNISGSSINTDKDLTVGNNIYINQNVNTNKKISFNSGNYIMNMYTNSINYLRIFSDYRATLISDGGAYVAVTGNKYGKVGVEIMGTLKIQNGVDFKSGGYFVNNTFLYGKSTGGDNYKLVGVGDNNWVYVGEHDRGLVLRSSNVRLGSTGGASVTSDRNLKTNIKNINDSYYEKFFMDLKPISYIYKNNHSRTHIGFIAQDVECSLIKNGLNNELFAGICIDNVGFYKVDDENSDERYLYNMGIRKIYSLRYEEFIALNTHMIQKCIKKINKLEEELKNTKSKLDSYINGTLEKETIV